MKNQKNHVQPQNSPCDRNSDYDQIQVTTQNQLQVHNKTPADPLPAAPNQNQMQTQEHSNALPQNPSTAQNPAQDPLQTQVHNHAPSQNPPTTQTQDPSQTQTQQLLARFQPLIKNLSRKLPYDEADGEAALIFFLVKLLRQPGTMDKLATLDEGALTAYIASSLKHEYIRLSKAACKTANLEVEFNEELLPPTIDSSYCCLELRLSLTKLPKRQQYILDQIFFCGYTERELAVRLGVSITAINRMKLRALKAMRSSL